MGTRVPGRGPDRGARQEELIAPGEAVDILPSPGPVAAPRPDGPFTAPVVEKYTDMAELILLDPVHDVSALGWPDAKTAGD